MPPRTGRPNKERPFNPDNAWRGPHFGLFDLINRTVHTRSGVRNLSEREYHIANAWRDGAKTVHQIQAHIARSTRSLPSEFAVWAAAKRLLKKLGADINND